MGVLLYNPNKAVHSDLWVVGLEANTTISGLDRHGNLKGEE